MHALISIIFVLSAAFCHAEELPAIARGEAKDEDIDLDTPGLLKKYGYPVETHEVITDDRYILRMFRIPYGKDSPLVPGIRKPAVLLQHGLMNSADDWVIIGPKRAFAYILADAGYDVWLGNARGNWYSQRHLNYSAEENRFWQFSWHENGVYDVPVQVDHILNVTSHEQIYYIGHSMGTTMFYVGMSEKPEYNKKIRAMISLAPIAYMNHMLSPLFQLFAHLEPPAQMILRWMGAGKFAPSQELLKLIQPEICKKEAITQPMCYNAAFLICGFNPEQVIKEKLAAISAHIPAGSSTGQFLHYAQGINKGHFRQFDYGPVKNKVKYGKREPHDYKLGNVLVPVHLFYSTNDLLAGPTDIDRLYNQLRNATSKYKIPMASFNHLDFIYGKNATELVYTPALKVLKSYENQQ